MDVRGRFAENMVRHRKRVDISQEELAARAALHRTEVGLLESGKRAPRIDTLVKIAGALGVPPVELLEGISWSPGSSEPGQFKVAKAKRKT